MRLFHKYRKMEVWLLFDRLGGEAAAQESLRQPLRGSQYPKNGIDCPLGHGV
jgi:hypothetical protein